MVAGIVAGKLEGLGLADCARLATAFAVTAISRMERGLGSPAELEAARQQVTVQQLV
jgi:fructose-1-phosphate kinase PfkB-like protein